MRVTVVAVLLTCHDRRSETLACLAALAAQLTTASLRVHLVDAGSRDGTADEVERRFPDVTVLRRGRELYWNSGMRAAWEHARSEHVDAYLWLNDDTHLDSDALERMLAIHTEEPGAIVVGAVRDPTTGAVTYSGVERPDPRRPLAFRRVRPGDVPRAVETMNGNCVLVPRAVVDRIGLLDAVFTHGMGDFDYGLRARAAGFEVLLAPGTMGTCAANAPSDERTVGEELDHLRGPKGLPPREWRVFAQRWAGPLWPLYFVSPYARRLVRRARGRRTP